MPWLATATRVGPRRPWRMEERLLTWDHMIVIVEINCTGHLLLGRVKDEEVLTCKFPCKFSSTQEHSATQYWREIEERKAFD